MAEPLECLEHGDDCQGDVEYLSLDPGVTKAFPRCEFHRERRIAQHEEHLRKYPVLQPDDFDPAYAGERWDED